MYRVPTAALSCRQAAQTAVITCRQATVPAAALLRRQAEKTAVITCRQASVPKAALSCQQLAQTAVTRMLTSGYTGIPTALSVSMWQRQLYSSPRQVLLTHGSYELGQDG